MSHLLLLNGPNLNLLGLREPGIYGARSLTDIESELTGEAAALGHSLECFQSNSEAELIERIHAAGTNGVQFILINPGALTHTSIALRDALAAAEIPFIEIHVSNTFAREDFRHRSYLSDLARGVIVGFGPLGYRIALLAAKEILAEAS